MPFQYKDRNHTAITNNMLTSRHVAFGPLLQRHCRACGHIQPRQARGSCKTFLVRKGDEEIPKRDVLMIVPSLLALSLVTPGPSPAIPLAPLGKVQRIGEEKLVGLSTEQVKDILARDIAEGQYFVTGQLTREIFADDCRFVDPTNDVSGLSRYVTALGILFDPEYSKVVLKDIRVTGPSTIEADYVSGGYLRQQYFPWRPKVDSFEGHIVYSLNDQGLVAVQSQTWSISAFEALWETFTPTSGPRPTI